MTTVILLAAGRGSRLKGFTADKPKCLNTVGGRTLLEWQLTALTGAGFGSVLAVTGYRKEMIEAYGIPTIHNVDWESTNMVFSLFCAVQQTTGAVLISYSDILYGAQAVKTLLSGAGPNISILYDSEWETLWRQRSTTPLADTESFVISE